MENDKPKRVKAVKEKQEERRIQMVYTVMLEVVMPAMLHKETGELKQPEDPMICAYLLFNEYPNALNILGALSKDEFLNKIENFSGFMEIVGFGLRHMGVPMLPTTEHHGVNFASIKAVWMGNIKHLVSNASEFNTRLGSISIGRKEIL